MGPGAPGPVSSGTGGMGKQQLARVFPPAPAGQHWWTSHQWHPASGHHGQTGLPMPPGIGATKRQANHVARRAGGMPRPCIRPLQGQSWQRQPTQRHSANSRRAGITGPPQADACPCRSVLCGTALVDKPPVAPGVGPPRANELAHAARPRPPGRKWRTVLQGQNPLPVGFAVVACLSSLADGSRDPAAA